MEEQAKQQQMWWQKVRWPLVVIFIIVACIGVAALIVVLSVFNGFEYEVRYRLLQSNAHIIASLYPAGLSDPDKWIQHIRAA